MRHLPDRGKGLNQKPGSTMHPEILSIRSRFGKRHCIPASCHNKLPQVGCLKITEIILSRFWRLEVGNQVVSGVGSFWILEGKILDASLLASGDCCSPWGP